MKIFAILICVVLPLVAAPKPDAVKVYKTVGEVELKLHIFNPEDHKETDQKPAIIFFFGGGWNGGTPEQFFPQSEYLAKRDMVAISAEYRVKSRHGTSPQECVKDGKSAIRWVTTHASELGIAPDQIAAGGGSAGGHVAAAIAMKTDINEEGEDLTISAIPKALVLFNPVYDNGPGGYGHDRVEDYWKKISPMHNIDKDTPPTIVFFGTKDKHVPVATAKKYDERLKSAGVKSQLFLYQDQPHGFFNKTKYDDTVTKMDAFLVELGLLKAQ